MKRNWKSFFCWFLGFCFWVVFFSFKSGADVVGEVNVFTGTGGIGFGVGSTSPAACVPFGMVRLGPDTSWNGINPIFAHNVGYWYVDNEIRGFSHTRLSGIGVTDYGNFRFMPAVGNPKKRIDQSGYISKFSHNDESAHPGYYSVILKDSGIKAEFTATKDAGFHKYTYPSDQNALLIVDLGRVVLDRYACGAELKIDAKSGEVWGWQKVCGSFTARAGGVKYYFFSRMNQPVNKFGIKNSESGIREGIEEASGKDLAAYFEFGTLNKPLLVKVGISLISVEQAKKNLDDQIPDWDFDKLLAQAEQAWEAPLRKIELKGGTNDQRSIFYSALYHSYIMPTDLTESGGVYLGFDNKVHSTGGRVYYSDFSIWDTFRNLHPLLVLLEPERSQDMIQSLVWMSEQGGYIPRWPTANIYTNCMTGTYGDCVIADAYIKGLRNFDVQTAYEKMLLVANEPTPEGHPYNGRPGIDYYKKLGYLPSDKVGSAPSSTEEYAYADFCIAQLASAMARDEDAKIFYERAGYYKNTYDTNSGFFRPRKSDGKFQTPFFPTLWGAYYTEGDAWHWLWTNWYDPSGLAELMGGKEKVIAKLNIFFEKGSRKKSNFLWNTYYWHGNEPDMHAGYMYSQMGRPDLTQKWVRWVMENKYKNSPDGLAGNDDAGTMSAWYIFSALGFYPLAGTDIYYLTAPLFPDAVMHLQKGDLKIIAPGAPDKIYIKSVKLNGKELNRVWIRHNEIINGAVLEFELSEEPADWGKNSPEPEFRVR